MKGYVYLIGAGCGTYDLITLRGLNALGRCDTVIYDALIDSSLLAAAPENAELICVGKRSGKHSAVQEEINALLAEKAADGHIVARLKGGDPFVFGRGGEEAEALKAHGIPYELISGVSSCIAVPEHCGIPVTHRGVSRAFHVITAHTAEGGRDFAQYASLDGTTVFLMGLGALPDIAAGLMRGGKPADTPAAVISDGCTVTERAVRGTLADIAGKAADAGMTAPAVIVVGDTAAYDFSCSSSHGALRGVSVTVTGTRKFTGRLGELLGSEGAEVCMHSHIRIEKKREIPPLKGFGCIAFTSSYGAEMFLAHCIEKHIDLRSLSGTLIAAVGSGTAATLSAAGIFPDIIPDTYTVTALAEKLADTLPEGCRLLILRAELGSEGLDSVLDSRGVSYEDVKIYGTVPAEGLPELNCRTDYIVFGSSSGVRFFFERGSGLSRRTKVVCIGRQTAETAKKYTENILLTASPHSAEGVLAAIKGDTQK